MDVANEIGGMMASASVVMLLWGLALTGLCCPALISPYYVRHLWLNSASLAEEFQVVSLVPGS